MILPSGIRDRLKRATCSTEIINGQEVQLIRFSGSRFPIDQADVFVKLSARTLDTEQQEEILYCLRLIAEQERRKYRGMV